MGFKEVKILTGKIKIKVLPLMNIKN